MANDGESGKKTPGKKSGDSLPLRNKGHEVDMVNMPDQTQPVLGRVFEPQDEVDVRISSQLSWDSTAESPRQPTQPTPRSEHVLKQMIDVRANTALSYQLPEEDRARLNRMQEASKNTGRKGSQRDGIGRITIKIGS